VPVLVLKLLLTPLLVGGSTLVARRWGPSIGGWIISLPLTSGPVLVFLALDQGGAFAAEAAVGALAGLAAICLFSLGYGRAARRAGPLPSLVVGGIAFLVGGLAMQPILATTVWLVAGIVVAAIALVSHLIPASRIDHPKVDYPSWDLPARMVVATAVVIGITAIAPVLGPHWSGIIATFPVYLAVLTAFTHVHAGPVAATDVLRGLLSGLYGTAAFFLVFRAAVEPYGIGIAIVSAIGAALAIGAVTLGRVRPGVRPEPA
jgi:hypothetical protein